MWGWENCQEESGTAVSSNNAKQWINYTARPFRCSSRGRLHVWSQQTTGARRQGAHPQPRAALFSLCPLPSPVPRGLLSPVHVLKPPPAPRDLKGFCFFSSFCIFKGFVLRAWLVCTAPRARGWRAGGGGRGETSFQKGIWHGGRLGWHRSEPTWPGREGATAALCSSDCQLSRKEVSLGDQTAN